MLYGWKENSMLTNCLAAYTHLSSTVSQLFEPQVPKIAVFTYCSPHFCFPWRRSCDYDAKCCYVVMISRHGNSLIADSEWRTVCNYSLVPIGLIQIYILNYTFICCGLRQSTAFWLKTTTHRSLN